jgi:D-aminopeptidase
VRVRREDRTSSTPVVVGRGLDPLFSAVVEASEEAVLNSIFSSPTVVGRSGNVSPGIPVDDVVDLMRQHHRIDA